MPDSTCAVDGCDIEPRRRGFCGMHYARLLKTGDAGPAGRINFPAPEECTVDGCSTIPKAKGLCETHWSRWYRYGDPLVTPFRPAEPSYDLAHLRLRRARGRASEHACQHCGSPARHWAYDHADPDERREPRRGGPVRPYSTDPAHYIPLCVPCHKAMDLAANKEPA